MACMPVVSYTHAESYYQPIGSRTHSSGFTSTEYYWSQENISSSMDTLAGYNAWLMLKQQVIHHKNSNKNFFFKC